MALRGGCTFRGYFVAALLVPLLRNGANRHPRLAVRSPLLYRSDVVLPLKAQPKKKEMQKHFFRDYFAPSGLVPLLRNGANQHPRITLRSPLLYRSDVVLVRQKYQEKEECKSILSGATSSLRSSCRRKRRSEPTARAQKYTPCGVCALSGTTSSRCSSCRLRRGEPTSENNISFSPALSFGCGSSPESATKEKRDAKMHLFFSWCTFRDSNPGPID